MELPKKTNTDEELVKLSLQGTWFFAMLVDRYETKLKRYVKRITGISDEDLDDVLQDIFIKVYEHLNDFDQSLKFSSWIYRIAHNEVVSLLRYKTIRRHESIDTITDEEFNAIASDIDVLNETMSVEYKKMILQALENIDKKYKEILILHYFEFKSYEEISDILLLPPGTVAVRLRRGKERLKNILHTNGYVHE